MADERTRALLAEGRPPRQTSIFVGLAVLAALVFVIVLRRPTKPPSPSVLPAPPPVPVYSVNPADQLSSAMAELEKLPISSGPPLAKIHEALEGAGMSDKGYLLPDGKLPPPLPADAPRAVRIGLALVQYQGAQLAPPNAQPRDVALARAKTIAELAKTDFAAAVKAGDHGSTIDIGSIHRGILEPGTQYVVFTMAPGSVSDVLETPRGFWIVRRIK